MADVTGQVQLSPDALSRLLDQDAMRAILSPDAKVPGASNPEVQLAEFWEVIDIVRSCAGKVFTSPAEAEAELFGTASGGGFGIRQDLRDAVSGLLVSIDAAPNQGGVAPSGGHATSGGKWLAAATVAQVSERLGNYVYVLVDPRDSRPFYVGKGIGLRMMSHGLEALDAHGDTDGKKVARIKEIRAAGLEHEIWIVRYGLTRSEYTAVEAAVIDTLGSFPVVPSAKAYRPLELREELTNMRREDAKGKGMILLERLVD